MSALVENIVAENDLQLGKLSDQLCPRHGLHFNPMLADGCVRCQEETRQERQARIALWIVVVTLLSVCSVMVSVTWQRYGGSLATSGNAVSTQRVK